MIGSISHLRTLRAATLRRALGALVLTCLSPSVFPAVVEAQSVRTASVAAPPAARAQTLEEASALAAAVVEAANLPGLSVAVGLDGDIVWAEGFGWADIENRVPVTALSKFRIGSVSKTLTATAIGRLSESGKLELDIPVQRYVPEFPEKRWPITSRQVAGHLAGIRHYNGTEFLLAKRFEDVKSSLEIFAADSLLFRPGTKYQYSSYGWNLLSAVIEGAAGGPFLAYMEREVFAPLGMRHTIPDWTDSLADYRVRFYEKTRDGRVINAPYVDNSYKWAGGGFLSTPSDLVRFGFGHLDPKVLKPETVRMLTTPQRLDSGEETGYGIGWMSGPDLTGRRTVGHGGGSVGGTTAFVVFPEESMVIAITSNLTGAPGLFPLAYTLADLFRPAPGTPTTGDVATGRFAFTTEPIRGDRRIEGTVELVRGPDGRMSGWVESRVGGPARVVLVRREGDATRVVAAGPMGPINLWLRVDGDRVGGRWAGPGGAVGLTGARVTG